MPWKLVTTPPRTHCKDCYKAAFHAQAAGIDKVAPAMCQAEKCWSYTGIDPRTRSYYCKSCGDKRRAKQCK